MLKKLFKGFLIISLVMFIPILLFFIVNKEYEQIFPLMLTSLFYVVPLVSMNKQKTSDNSSEKAKIIKGYMKHMSGLPIAEGVKCEVSSLPTMYKFKANNAEFKLDKSRVVDVCVKTDVEIQKQYVSSIGGAIGGALVFGALGAIVGGRTKQKVNKEYTFYSIITYNKDDKLEYISFEISQGSFFGNKLASEFKKTATPNSAITSFDL